MHKKYFFLVALCSTFFILSETQGQSYASFKQQSDKNKSEIGLKPKAPSFSAKQMDVIAMANNGYITGSTHNVYFTFIINNIDFEYGDSVSMTFPAGITVNSVSNDEIFGPAFDPGGAPEAFNGIDGQTVSWGDNDNDYGGITSQGNVYSFSVNLTFDGGLSGDQLIDVHMSGDMFGASPGDQDFTITLQEDVNGTAQVQIIHNSADLAAAVVDVRVNGGFPDPSYDDFEFRTATSFLEVTAAQDLLVTINDPGSSDDSSPLFSQTVSFDPGISYVVVADGIVSDIGYEPQTPFSLEVYPDARQAANEAGFTDVLVHHGSTDAPTVNVLEPIIGAALVNNISYPEFDGYLSLPTDNYTLEVSLANGTTVNVYDAALADLGLEDAAITVVASGFVDPSSNSNGEGFGLWTALASGGALVELNTVNLAQVQVIHNCADLAAEVVDVRINGELPPALDDFEFRTATPFLALSTEGPMVITVNDQESVDDSNPLYEIDLTGALMPNAKYILVAEGISSDVGYVPDASLVPFQIRVIENAREGASENGNTDLLVIHGSTDAPNVDIDEITVPVEGLVQDLAYGAEDGYIELATDNYAIQLFDSESGAEIGTYSAPLLNGNLGNLAVSIVASGFVSPFDNQDGPEFGLWLALPAGGNLFELGLFSVNDSPCDAISVSTDGTTVEGGNSVATIDDGEVVPPDGPCSTFTNWCDGDGDLADLDNTIWYSFVAPESGVVEVSTCHAGTNFDTQVAVWSFTDCTDYSTYSLLGANDDYDTSQDCESPNPYASRLTTCGLNAGETYLIQVDGYNGSIGDVELSVTELDALTCSARIQVVNNAADMATGVIDFRINGNLVSEEHDDLEFRNATATIDIPAGGTVNLSVNPSTSVDDSEALLVVPDVVFTPGETYQVIIHGISSDFGYDPGNTMAPLELVIVDGFEEINPNPNNTSIAVVHGSTDAPNVDVDELFEFDAQIVGDLEYNEVFGYTVLPTGNYSIGLTLPGEDEIIAAYFAPLEDLDLGGTAISIFASGFFNPGANSNGPEFGLWASLPEGGELIPLQVVTSTEEQNLLNGLSLFPNPAENNFQYRFDLQSNHDLRVEIYDLSGRLVKNENLGPRAAGLCTESMDVQDLDSGYYLFSIRSGKNKITKPLQIIR